MCNKTKAKLKKFKNSEKSVFNLLKDEKIFPEFKNYEFRKTESPDFTSVCKSITIEHTEVDASIKNKKGSQYKAFFENENNFEKKIEKDQNNKLKIETLTTKYKDENKGNFDFLRINIFNAIKSKLKKHYSFSHLIIVLDFSYYTWIFLNKNNLKKEDDSYKLIIKMFESFLCKSFANNPEFKDIEKKLIFLLYSSETKLMQNSSIFFPICQDYVFTNSYKRICIKCNDFEENKYFITPWLLDSLIKQKITWNN